MLVREVPNEAAAAMALIEKHPARRPEPAGRAQGLQRLIREFGTHEQAAQAVGRSRSRQQFAALLNLAEPVQTMLMAGDIAMGHAVHCWRWTAPRRSPRQPDRGQEAVGA